jgi:hypothetical protein
VERLNTGFESPKSGCSTIEEEEKGGGKEEQKK